MISKTIDKYDNIDLSKIFRYNIKSSGLIGLLQLFFIVYMIFEEDMGKKDILINALFCAFVLSVFFSGLIALLKHKYIQEIFRYHAVIILLIAIYAGYFSIKFAINGLPEGNFGWAPGMPTFLSIYGVYCLRIGWLSEYIQKESMIKYAHVFSGFIIGVFDAIVTIRLFNNFFA